MDELELLYQKLSADKDFVQVYPDFSAFQKDYSSQDDEGKKRLYHIWGEDAGVDENTFLGYGKKKSTGSESGSPSSSPSPEFKLGGSFGSQTPKEEPSFQLGGAPKPVAGYKPSFPGLPPVQETPVEKTTANFQEQSTKPYDTFYLNGRTWTSIDGTDRFTYASETDLGNVLLNGQTVEISGDPIKYQVGDEVYETKYLNKEIFRNYLLAQNFTEEQADQQIKDLQNKYLTYQAGQKDYETMQYLLNKNNGDLELSTKEYKGINQGIGVKLLNQEDTRFLMQYYPEYERLANLQKEGKLQPSQVEYFEELRAKMEDFMGPDKDQLYDPVTGKFINRASADDEQKQSAQRQEQLYVQYKNTDRDSLERLRNELIVKQGIVLGKINELRGTEEEPGTMEEIGQWAARNVLSASDYQGIEGNKVEAFRIIDLYENLKEINNQLYVVNRAYMLNLDPTKDVRVRSASDVFSKTLVSSLPLTEDSVPFVDQAGSFVGALKSAGIQVTPEQEEAAKKTFGQEVAEAGASTIPAIAAILITKNFVTNPAAQSALGRSISTQLTTAYGQTAGKVLFNVLENAVAYELAGQGAATGAGESVVQDALDSTALTSITGKLMGKAGPLGEFITRVVAGAVGETLEEFTGQYVQALSDSGFDWEKAADETFGNSMDDFTKKLAIIGILGAGGAVPLASGKVLSSMRQVSQQLGAQAESATGETKEQLTEIKQQLDKKLNEQPEETPQTTEASVLNTPSGTESIKTDQIVPDQVQSDLQTTMEKFRGYSEVRRHEPNRTKEPGTVGPFNFVYEGLDNAEVSMLKDLVEENGIPNPTAALEMIDREIADAEQYIDRVDEDLQEAGREMIQSWKKVKEVVENNKRVEDFLSTKGITGTIDFKVGEEEDVEVDVEKVQKLVDQMQKTFPGSNLTVYKTTDDVLGKDATGKEITPKTLIEDHADGEQMRTYRGLVYGFRIGSQIYINERSFNSNTAVHEFGHIWTDVAPKEVLDEGINLLKQYGQEYIDKINSSQVYRDMTDERKLKEALVTAIGDRGATLKDKTFGDKIRAWVDTLFEKVGIKLGLTSFKPTTPFNAYLDGVVQQITSGKPVDVSAISPTFDAAIRIQVDPKWTTTTQEIIDADNAIRAGKTLTDTEAARELIRLQKFPIPQMIQVLGKKFSDSYEQAVLEDGKLVLERQEGKILARRAEAVDRLLDPNLAVDDVVVSLKNEGYADFEIANALISAGYPADVIKGLYGENYHAIISRLIESEGLAPGIVESLEMDARNMLFEKHITEMVDSVSDVPIMDSEALLKYMLTKMNNVGFEEHAAKLVDFLRSLMRGGQLNAELQTLNADLASMAGRILRFNRDLAVNKAGVLEELIVEGVEDSGRAMTPHQREILKSKVKAVTDVKERYDQAVKDAKKAYDEGLPSDDVLAAVSNTEREHIKLKADLNRYTSKFLDPLLIERFISGNAKSLLSSRSPTVGLYSNFWNWIYTASAPIRFLQGRVVDPTLQLIFPHMNRVIYSGLSGKAQTDIVETTNKQKGTVHSDGTMTISVGDTRNFRVGSVVLDEHNRQGQIVKKTRDTITITPIGELDTKTGQPIPFDPDNDFRSGGTVTRVLPNNSMWELAQWGRKYALNRAGRQIKTTLRHGYNGGDKLIKNYGDSFVNFDVVNEFTKFPRLLMAYAKGNLKADSTHEDMLNFLQEAGIKVIENGVESFRLPNGKPAKILGQALSSFAAMMGLPGEGVTRLIALSGDRVAFNAAYMRAMMNYAQYLGLRDAEAIKMFMVTHWGKEFDDEFAPAQLGQRQIFANKTLLSKMLIGGQVNALWGKNINFAGRGGLLRKSKQIRAAYRKGEIGFGPAALKRIGLESGALGMYLLSPFSTIPGNVFLRGLRLTHVPMSSIMFLNDLSKLMLSYRSYLTKYPDTKEKLSKKESTERKIDEDRLFYLRTRAVQGATDLAVASLLAGVATAIISYRAATPPSGSDRDRDVVGMASGKEPGLINFTHWLRNIPWYGKFISGFLDGPGRKPDSEWQNGDVVMNYQNAGSFGMGLAMQFASRDIYNELFRKLETKSPEKIDFSNFAAAFGSFGGALDGISLMQSYANVLGVFSDLKKGEDTALDKLVLSVMKTLASQLAPNAFSFLSRADGVQIDNLAQFYPRMEDGAIERMPKLLLRTWTSLSGRTPFDWMKSPLYRAKIGPLGEDLSRRTGFSDHGTTGAYLTAMFDPFNLGYFGSQNMTEQEKENARMYVIIQQAANFYTSELSENSPLYRFSTGDMQNSFPFVKPGEPYDKYDQAAPDAIFRDYLRTLGGLRRGAIMTIVSKMEDTMTKTDPGETDPQVFKQTLEDELKREFEELDEILKSVEQQAKEIYMPRFIQYIKTHKDMFDDQMFEEIKKRTGRDLRLEE